MAETVTTPTTPANGAPSGGPVLPAEIQLWREDVSSASFTPRQLRMVRETFGRAYAEVMADEASDDRLRLLGWLKLQEDVGPFPIELMDDVRIKLPPVGADGKAMGRPDPFDAASSTPSSDSAGGGE